MVTTLAFVIAALSALFVIGNIGRVLLACWNRWHGSDKGYSLIPLVSFVLGLVACLIGYRLLWLWPVILSLFDPGTWAILYLPWAIRSASLNGKQNGDRDKDDGTD